MTSTARMEPDTTIKERGQNFVRIPGGSSLPLAVTVLHADDAARLADFARACKAAARAVSLYPGAHPAIGVSLGRLVELTARLTQTGSYRLQVTADQLLINGI